MNPATQQAYDQGNLRANAAYQDGRRRFTIDPITRLEGHGKIDIFLDDKGDVERAYLQVPELHNVVRSLDQVVDVDYYVPGCPPTPNLTKAAITALLEGKLPPKGSVLAPDIALCDECSRKKSKPTNLSITEFKRPHQLLADPEL